MIKDINFKTGRPPIRAMCQYYGGKSREVPFIKTIIKKQYENYYEPFVGSGVIFANLDCAKNYYISDISPLSIGILKFMRDNEDFYDRVVKKIKTIKTYEDLKKVHYKNKDNWCKNMVDTIILLLASYTCGDLKSQTRSFQTRFSAFIGKAEIAKDWHRVLQRADIKPQGFEKTPIKPNSLYILDPPYIEDSSKNKGADKGFYTKTDSNKIAESINDMILAIRSYGSDFIYWNYLNDVTIKHSGLFNTYKFIKKPTLRGLISGINKYEAPHTIIMSNLKIDNNNQFDL